MVTIRKSPRCSWIDDFNTKRSCADVNRNGGSAEIKKPTRAKLINND